MNEILERFTAEAITSAVFGTIGDDEVLRAARVVKSINRDLRSLSGFKLLLSSLMPRIFRMKIFQSDVDEFFAEIAQQRHKSLIDELNESDVENIPAQVLIFFAGG